jgi:3-hydroxyisobutyrate dehydrogenase-like beta-hydroxyacid dehydrogenase
MQMTDVSVIGTGLMGTAVASAFLGAGKTVTAWNRSSDKTRALAEQGAAVADSAEAAIASSPVSVLLLPNYDIVKEVLSAAGDSLDGHVVVNLTTGQPEQAGELANWLGERGGQLLDGCILEYPSEIGTAGGKLKYGGPADLWNKWRDLLIILGGASELIGEDIRSGNIVDSAVLTFYIAACAAVVEAGAFGAAYGMMFQTLAPHLKGVASTNLEWLISNSGDKIAAADYSNDQATVDVYLAAVEGIVEAMDTVGLKGRLTEATRDSLQLAQDAGSGHQDFASIYPQLMADVGVRHGSA